MPKNQTSAAQPREKAGATVVLWLLLGLVVLFGGLYVAAHYFDGEARTLGGFHEDHSLISLGVRTRF